jgi:hypothetical protein
MTIRTAAMVSFVLALTAGPPAAAADRDAPKPAEKAGQWRGIHVINYNNDRDLETLGGQVPKLAPMGVNVLVVEVNYNFQFKSNPKLRQGRDPITPKGAAKLAAVCRKHGVRLIPEFNCLGHQS